jgi:hypothetical protein
MLMSLLIPPTMADHYLCIQWLFLTDINNYNVPFSLLPQTSNGVKQKEQHYIEVRNNTMNG